MIRIRKVINKKIFLGTMLILIEVLVLCIVPAIYIVDPNKINANAFGVPPCLSYPLGTDNTGRDMLARLLHGGRTSLAIGILSTAIDMGIGIPLGLVAGYYQGLPKMIVLRLSEVLMAFPTTVLVLVLVSIWGGSPVTIILVLGGIGWVRMAKLIYSNVLSVTGKEYVQVAKMLGIRDSKIILKEILPNVVAPMWSELAFSVVSAIKVESALSFLGVGIRPPAASWGNIIYSAQNLIVLTRRLWMWLPAAICLIITVISMNQLGEGLRDLTDVKNS